MAVTHDTGAKPLSGSELAADLIGKARAAFDVQRDDQAFDFLDRAVSNTADPGLLDEIHALAREGHDRAGFIARHTMWSGLVKAVERLRGEPRAG